MNIRKLFFFLIFLCSMMSSMAQQLATREDKHFFSFEPEDSLNKSRLLLLSSVGGLSYATIFYGLDQLWYRQYSRSAFHFFNDGGEWMDLDKMGHAQTAYLETEWVHSMSRWAGVQERRAIWAGFAASNVLQLTIEAFDGFSEKWGFSWRDIAANSAGASLFAVQQSLWREQRIRLKLSMYPVKYGEERIYSTNTDEFTTFNERADRLFGASLVERLLKDYNGQTYWLSINPSSFMDGKNIKKWQWLNIAIGNTAHNMYGGYSNQWKQNGASYSLSSLPRYREYLLSLDIDWTRIPTRRAWVKTLFKTMNVIKLPFPALAYSSVKKWQFYPVYF